MQAMYSNANACIQILCLKAHFWPIVLKGMTHWPVSGACFSRLVPETGQSVILF